MKKDPKDNKLSLSVEDIGSEIEDAKVTCIKVFCPRKANNFVSFLCDGRFTVCYRRIFRDNPLPHWADDSAAAVGSP